MCTSNMRSHYMLSFAQLWSPQKKGEPQERVLEPLSRGQSAVEREVAKQKLSMQGCPSSSGQRSHFNLHQAQRRAVNMATDPRQAHRSCESHFISSLGPTMFALQRSRD